MFASVVVAFEILTLYLDGVAETQFQQVLDQGEVISVCSHYH